MPAGPATAVSIGNFDGVHLGHRALLAAARACAGHNGRVVAVVFYPHPASMLAGRTAPQQLTDMDERARLLLAAGADEVVRLEPSPELLTMSPEGFVNALAERFCPTCVVEGPDFRFGRDRRGDVHLLREAGQRLGFQVHIVDPVDVVLSDHAIVRASSTMLRWLVSQGRVQDAATLLGRPYALCGVVEPGARRGRTIGIPTANLKTAGLVPADGVYAARALLESGQMYRAAVNIGMRPTVAGTTRTIEAHVLDLPDAGGTWRPLPALPEYGWSLRLEFVTWLRDQLRFPSLEALGQQIARDMGRVRDLVEIGEPSTERSVVGATT